MNPAQLLTYFGRISDAPDAVPRLRRLILTLAVRGKLISQDANDEPASELLLRLQAEKARLTKNGKIRKEEPLAAGDKNSMPFTVPKHWACLQLNRIGLLSGGMTPSMIRSDFWDGDINWFSPKDIKSDELFQSELKITRLGVDETGLQIYRPGSLFIVARSGILKRTFPIAINRVEATANQDLKVLTPFIEGLERYLQIMFRGMTDFILTALVKTGTTVQSLKYEEFERQALPLPPLAEQHRIVAKVDELMALCDRLEAAQVEREGRRDRLAAASLHRLNQPAVPGDPQAFREHARFHLQHLPRLTTRPEHIKQLRQTILNLAVRGQLVPQNPNDEPAAELLKRIQAEKARLVKEGIIKKFDSIALPAGSEFPSPMPLGWMPSNLQSLCISVTDGDHIPPPKADQGIPFLVIGNVRSQTVNFAGCRHVSEQYYNALDTIRRPQKGDILYTLVGSYGIPIMITDDKPFCVQRHIGILRPSLTINARFLSRILESQWVFDQATSYATGIAQKTVPLAGLRRILIPLPPLAEQHRIVAKVDELMALCDQLEAQLTTAQSESRRLLESVLHQTLDGGSEAD